MVPAGSSVWVEYNNTTGRVESIGFAPSYVNETDIERILNKSLDLGAIEVNDSQGLSMLCYAKTHGSMPWTVNPATRQIASD